jgi:hypothetical protein
LKKAALLICIFAIADWPALADSQNTSLRRPSHITCEMVRSYVAQVGLAQAKAMAIAAGMTASEEQRARQCLANKI